MNGWLLIAATAEPGEAARMWAKTQGEAVCAQSEASVGSAEGCRRILYAAGRGPVHSPKEARVVVYLR